MGFKNIQLEEDLIFTNIKIIQQIKDIMSEKFVELDFHNVHRIDSTGIDILIRLIRSLKKNEGDLRIIKVNMYVFEILEMCGIPTMIEVSQV